MMHLSDWHAARAAENEDIEDFTPIEKRKQAVGSENDFPYDKGSMFFTRHAEKMFEPKKITDCGDWLVSQKEGH